MKQLYRGQFFGQTNSTNCLEGLTLTDTIYTHANVDWHYHEHAYFTFILQGNVLEGNKKELYHCGPGSLLFHNWEEPHYNSKPPGFTRGFHLEVERKWFDDMAMPGDDLRGSYRISNPDIKLLMYKIFRASKMEDASSALSIHTLLMEAFSRLYGSGGKKFHNRPKWVNELEQILHDLPSENMTLNYLSTTLNIHPVHLSRDFSKYFNCNLGEYIRKLKVEKALSLISSQKYSFAEIAYECGFADQSHFIRCFKEFNGLNPSVHLKLFLKD